MPNAGEDAAPAQELRDAVPGEAVPLMTTEDLRTALRDEAQLCLFLDYDGTLAPIVDQPELAFISDECRATLQSVAATCPVALVSGRSNDKLRAFVQLDGLYLAGSHGVHIVGPYGAPVDGPDPEAMLGVDALAALDAARTELDDELGSIPGYLTENNVYCITAHYRMVAPSEHERVRDAVLAVLARYPVLCHKEGKMVHELRPSIAWDKGKAVEWLLAMLKKAQADGAAGASSSDAAADEPSCPPPALPLLPVYLGDDVADEDAFRAVAAAGGIGIKVADAPLPRSATAATWYVPQTQVVDLLASCVLEASPAKTATASATALPLASAPASAG